MVVSHSIEYCLGTQSGETGGRSLHNHRTTEGAARQAVAEPRERPRELVTVVLCDDDEVPLPDEMADHRSSGYLLTPSIPMPNSTEPASSADGSPQRREFCCSDI